MRQRSGFVGLVLAGSTVLGACAMQSGTAEQQTSVSASPPAASAAAMEEQILRGRALVLSHACSDCHGGGSNPSAKGWLAGGSDIPMGPLTVRPVNLTPDSATGIGRYTERQIFNALRYGLRMSTTPDVEITSTAAGEGNHPVEPDYLAPSMPWLAWRHLPDAELRAIAAYLKRGLLPVRNEVPASDTPPDKWRANFVVERVGPYPAYPHPTENETAVTSPEVLRGREVAIQMDCAGCHGGGPNPAAKGYLAGITSPAGEFEIGPFKTRPRNLTPDNTTGIGRFTERQIFNALRYGLRPGETPDVEITSTTPGEGNFPERPKYMAPPMPWPSWRHASDEDLRAVAAYLKRGLKPVSNRVADSEGPPDFWADTYKVEAIGSHPAVPFPTANERPFVR